MAEKDAFLCFEIYELRNCIWVRDPDGHQWEFFVVTQADAPVQGAAVAAGAGDAACCATDVNKAPASLGCCVSDAAPAVTPISCCTPAAG